MAGRKQTGKKVIKEKPSGKRKALGRGLSALMSTVNEPVQKEVTVNDWREPETKPVSQPELSPSEEPADLDEKPELKIVPKAEVASSPDLVPDPEGFVYLDISKLVAAPGQPRKNFAEAELESLAASIKESGLIQPILVRSAGAGSYEIVAGERRYRAASQAGLKQVPVHIRDLSEREAFELSIVENVQREDLDPIEEARAYERLASDFGESHSVIAKAVGKDRVTIANMLRLLQLPEAVLKLLQNGKLSPGHGRALLMAPERLRLKFAQRVIAENLSVRATEALASGRPAASKRPQAVAKEQKSPSILALENRIRQGLGTKVELQMNGVEKGELRVSFFSKEELESLLERLGV